MLVFVGVVRGVQQLVQLSREVVARLLCRWNRDRSCLEMDLALRRKGEDAVWAVVCVLMLLSGSVVSLHFREWISCCMVQGLN